MCKRKICFLVYKLWLAKGDPWGLGAESWLVVAGLLFAKRSPHCTEVGFAGFLSSGFITATLVNPCNRKLAKCTPVH